MTLQRFLHKKHLHVGPQALLAAAWQNYWPISGRQLAKRVCRECIICSRAKPWLLQQQMADLPTERVNPAPPFFKIGIDYAGPFFVHYKIRGKIPSKTSLVIFICLVTKAVHLELASDLTSASLIGAFKRFVATRGVCNTETAERINTVCNENLIIWKFAPHFGGIYEAAVNSAKFHLRRMMGNAILTYEELNTLMKQVEAVLNSRPITPITTNDNIEILTPVHFLIGLPLTAIPEPSNNSEENVNYLKHWQLVQHLHAQFWKTWSSDYFQQLQHRYYWQNKSTNLTEGTVVIIKDDNLPPLKWKFRKVVELHPGHDGMFRVGTVKTQTGNLRRAITKLNPLPTEIEHGSA